MNPSLKPLEPGCLALVTFVSHPPGMVPPYRVGSVVTIKDRSHIPPDSLHGTLPCQRCCRPFPNNTWDIEGPGDWMAHDCSLMRIDPDGETKEEFETELEDYFDELMDGVFDEVERRGSV